MQHVMLHLVGLLVMLNFVGLCSKNVCPASNGCCHLVLLDGVFTAGVLLFSLLLAIHIGLVVLPDLQSMQR